MINFQEYFEKFNDKKILVVGDVMLDTYIRGKVARVSPEAPVPIVSFDKEEERLGGAANVAVNLVALGAKPIICSVVGNDNSARAMSTLFEESGISVEGLVYSSVRKTTVKTRVIGNNQHLLRIDAEQTNDITEVEQLDLYHSICKLIDQGIDAIIFEDYNKGVLTKWLIEKTIELANQNGIITCVDPKKHNFLSFKNVTLFKPNLKELKEGLMKEFNFSNQRQLFEDAVHQLETLLNNEISFVTLSEHGVFIKRNNEKHYVPAHLRNIADVSGAGDTVISVATLCLLSGLSIDHVAEIANIAGGLVCEESGVVSISKLHLLQETESIFKAKEQKH